VAVLDLLAEHPDQRFTLSEVARRCDLNKATAHALLSALTAHGVLLRHPDEKRYSLGPRLVAIGTAARRGYSAADFVPSVLERLSAETGLWSRAFTCADDRVLQVGQANAPGDVDPARWVDLPLVPPVGSLWMAWADPASVEAWLARAATVEVVGPAHDVLPVIRRRGFSVTLASPEWQQLSIPSATGLIRDLLSAIGRQPLLLGEIDEAATYRVGDVAAPVFDILGQVDLAIAVSGFDDQAIGGAALRELGERVVEAGNEVTLAITGRPPVASGPA
jgi:DNA-binding IclR family transcriptional regulator